eukprot:1118202-Pyramimonas_sp.AAC.1
MGSFIVYDSVKFADHWLPPENITRHRRDARRQYVKYRTSGNLNAHALTWLKNHAAQILSTPVFS